MKTTCSLEGGKNLRTERNRVQMRGGRSSGGVKRKVGRLSSPLRRKKRGKGSQSLFLLEQGNEEFNTGERGGKLAGGKKKQKEGLISLRLKRRNRHKLSE